MLVLELLPLLIESTIATGAVGASLGRCRWLVFMLVQMQCNCVDKNMQTMQRLLAQTT